MAQIHNYQNEALTFGDDDFYDIDFYTGSGYETKKIKGSTIKTAIANSVTPPNVRTLYSDDDSLASNRIVKGSAGTHFLQLSEMAHFHVDCQNSQVECVKFTVPSNDGISSFVVANSANQNPMFSVENGYVKINDKYKLPLNDGSAGQILSTDGSGLAQWIDAPQSGVTSVNTFTGAVTIQGSGSTTVTNNAGTIDISSTGGAGNTIYDADDSLTSDRIVDGGKGFHDLTFTDLGSFNVDVPLGNEQQPDAVTFDVPLLSKVYQFIIRNINPIFHIVGDKVHINNSYFLPNVSGKNGDVITSDGAGGTSWASSGGGSGNASEEINYYQISNSADTRPIYTDSFINLGWDETGNDLELTMLVAPAVKGQGIYCLATKSDNTGSQQTYITQINTVTDVFNAGIGAGYRGNITIQAQDDINYPFYQIEIFNPSESLTKIGVCIRKIQR